MTSPGEGKVACASRAEPTLEERVCEARDALARLVGMLLLAVVAACASTPPPTPPVRLQDDGEPVAVSRPSPQPMVEYPPIEPVEPPEVLEPPPSPSPEIAAPPAAPATMPTPAVPSVATPAPASPPIPAPVVPEISVEEQQMNALLADLNRYSALAPDDVKREIGLATAALSRQRTDHNRIRLAFLYTLTRTSSDDQHALQLFDNVLKGTAPNGVAVKSLAAILQVQVAERIRAVRDEQRKSEVAVQKLEALREMERSLLRDRVRSGGGGGAAGGTGGSAGGGGGGSAGR